MSDLTVTHRTAVTEDQIDHLGHMNVRFYGVAAQAATRSYVEPLATDEDTRVAVEDLYTRHHREQLLGADLEVRTGVLDASAGTLALYHELVNCDTDDVAATFVYEVVARRPDGSRDDRWPGTPAATITPPPHGKPRSISLDRDPRTEAPALSEVQARDCAIRHPREVTADECDADGRVVPTFAPMLHWGGESIDGAMGPTLHDGPDGEVIGFASMETRLSIARLPRVGDRIQSFAATRDIADKTMQQVMWVYDLDRGDVLTTFEVVNLAFDTVGRRAVSIPDDLRAEQAKRLWR